MDAGAPNYTVRFLSHDFNAVVRYCRENRAGCLHATLRQFVFAVARVLERASELSPAATAHCCETLQRAGVLDIFPWFAGLPSLERDTVAAVIAFMQAAESTGGTLPMFETTRMALLSEWLLPTLVRLENGPAGPEMPFFVPGNVRHNSLGAFLWAHDDMFPYYKPPDYGEHRKLALFEAFSLLATTPPARALALRLKVFRPIFTLVCRDFMRGCRRNRCTDMAVGGAALRQMCYAPEALKNEILLARIKDVLAMAKDNLQRWVIVYTILPMARAERKARASNAEEAQRAACLQRCCDFAISAPQTLAALDRAGILEMLCFVLETSPTGRRSACLALSLLLGRDAAQLLPQLAGRGLMTLCGSAHATTATAKGAAAAAARRSAQQTLRRRIAKAAALKERQADTNGDVTECLTPGDGCESDCEGASDDDDADGESAPFCAALLATLNCATAGLPPPPLPAHGVAVEAAAGSAVLGSGGAASESGRATTAGRRKKGAAASAPDAAAVAAAEAAAAALLAEEEEEAAKASRAASRKSSKKSKAAKQKQKQAQQSAAADEAAEDDASEPPAVEAAQVGDAAAEQAAPLPAAAAPARHAAAACRDGCCAPAAPFRLGAQRQRAAPPANEAEAAPAAAAAAATHAAAPAGAEPESGVSAEDLMAELFPHLRLQGETIAGPAPAAAAAPPAELDDDMCVICMDAPRDTPLAACADRHAPVLCGACAASVLVQGSRVCPWCSTPLLPS